jgi:DNA-directed RNA polymerase specialized sigma24 family protein
MWDKQGTEASELAVEKALERERLVLAIASGDRKAEEIFVRQYLPRVKAMLLARTRDPDLAADLQQDVMIEAICALRRGQLREVAKLSSFVLGIARNLLNSHFKNAARQPIALAPAYRVGVFRRSARSCSRNGPPCGTGRASLGRARYFHSGPGRSIHTAIDSGRRA